MPPSRSSSGSLVAGLLAASVLAGGILYIEGARTPGERALRSRGCLVCHQDSFAAPLPCLRSWEHGSPLVPHMARAFQKAHPRLSRGVPSELPQELAARQLPALAVLREQDAGERLFRAKCAACHGYRGEGAPGQAPPLLHSEWLTDSPSRLPEILSHGLEGPITVQGEFWDMPMLPPRLSQPADQEALIRYLRETMAAPSP